MDAPTATKPVKINRWLPYWAVLQNDIRQTLASWVYRTWVLVSLLLGGGYLLYRWAVHMSLFCSGSTCSWIRICHSIISIDVPK